MTPKAAERPVTTVAREIAGHAHFQARTSRDEELAKYRADYLRIVPKIASGSEPTPAENELLGDAMQKLGYLDADGAKLASDVEVLHRLATAFPAEMKDETSYRRTCEKLWQAARAAGERFAAARDAANEAFAAHRQAETEQQVFEAQRREMLNLKKFNARLFGDLEQAIDPDSPNVGVKVERIRQYEDTHRRPSEASTNYMPHTVVNQTSRA